MNFVRRIYAIALHTLRAATRSRLVAALSVILAGAAIALPLLVEGDGSPDGDLRVATRYALGVTVGVLSLATLWASCAAVSVDAATRRLALTRVKPVRAVELWLGKWLGIVALDAMLLAASGIAFRAALAIRAHRMPEHAGMVARIRHPPAMPTVREEAEAVLKNHPPPPDMDREAALRVVMSQVPEYYRAIAPGETVTWEFPLARHLPAGSTLWLRMDFAADKISRQSVTARCRMASDNGGATSFRVDDFTDSLITIPVDASSLAGAKSVAVDFTYAPETPDAGSLLVQPRRGLALLEPAHGFGANLARAMAVELTILAALAALGVTFGMLFTFPVAAFCATGLLLSVFASAYAMEEAIDPEDPPDTFGGRAAQETAAIVTAASKPMLDPHPLGMLADGELVPWRDILGSAGWNLAIAPALLAALGAAAFARKEE